MSLASGEPVTSEETDFPVTMEVATMGTALTVLNKLPVLKKRRLPSLAFAIGFLFGGVGLGLYFRSFIDFLAPIAVILALSLAGYGVGSGGYLVGAFIAGLYGAFRAANSNDRLAAATHTTSAVA